MCPRLVGVFLTVFTLTLSPGRAEKKADESVSLWRDPGGVMARDLFYGAGSEERAPIAPFSFVEEDLDGVSPKFVLQDSQGVKWKVKLGDEARPETVATRFVWAMGYATDENYFVRVQRVENMPAELHRGGEFISSDGSIRDARWERMDQKRIGNWRWAKNPFDDTRELNGLRVLMAFLNNWACVHAWTRPFAG